jgi:hypothetical protein
MTTGLIAQSVSDLPPNSFPYNFAGSSVMAYDNRYEGVKGTYTFLENFSLGTVELKRGKFSNVLINYDALTDNLLAINDKLKDTVQMRKDMVMSFVMDNNAGEKFVFTKQSVNGVSVFLLELVNDTTSLFCRIGKTIKKAEIGGAYKIDENMHDEFVTSNTFYVAKWTNDLQELQKNKKAVLKMFPEFNDQLSVYLKQNKTDFKDQEDMKRLIQYVNTLKE